MFKGKRTQAGFTIIELMIATSVLSTILLLVTVIMISIGNLYYKGINQSRIQDGARSIVDDISQHLELTNSPLLTSASPTSFPWPPGTVPVSAYCVGSTRYSYAIGRQIGSGTDTDGQKRVPHILWRDTIAAGSVCSPANLTQANPSAGMGGSNGTELLTPNSRLTYLRIAGTSPYTIDLGLAYGDADLLHLDTTSAAASTCKGNTGDQFCGTANLTTTVVKRL